MEFSKSNALPIAGINGDFFNYATGQPIGNQIVDGQIVSGAPSKRSHLTIDERGKPRIEFLNFKGVAWAGTGFRDSIHCINQSHSENGLALYTSKWLDTVAVGYSRFKLPLCLIGAHLAEAETLRFVAVQQEVLEFGTRGDSLFFLSLPSTPGFSPLNSWDTLSMLFSLGGGKHYQAIGGGGRFLHESNVIDSLSASSEGIEFDFVVKPHPRTFVAFGRDTNFLVLGVVDGRQEKSRGMNLLELGRILLLLGYTEGINLDGGGSTTMIVNGRVVNTPSDTGGERKVANGIFILKK
jgi:hypothetical protein